MYLYFEVWYKKEKATQNRQGLLMPSPLLFLLLIQLLLIIFYEFNPKHLLHKIFPFVVDIYDINRIRINSVKHIIFSNINAKIITINVLNFTYGNAH